MRGIIKSASSELPEWPSGACIDSFNQENFLGKVKGIAHFYFPGVEKDLQSNVECIYF